MMAKDQFRLGHLPLACAVLLLVLDAGVLAIEPVVVLSPDGPLPAVVSGPTQTDRNAATDLCAYLSRVSGREITASDEAGDACIIIHVGRDVFVDAHAPQIDELYADGFIIQGVAQEERYHIILAGRMEPSSQWAIERFLRDFAGVRWLFPDPVYGEIVPSRRTIEVERDLSRVHEPDYMGRGNMGMYYFNPARTHLRGGPVGYQYGRHAIQFIFSEPEFKKHPEWFAFFGGKRQWWSYGNGWQICSTNPGTVDHAVNYVLDYFEKNPLEPMVSVGNNDGWGECECAECMAFLDSADPPYTVSERWWHWVNQVARKVQEQHPDKWIESLAYSQTSQPPRFQLEENVAITKTIVLGNELELAEQWSQVCKSVNLYSYMYGNSFIGFRHYPAAARDFLKWGKEKLGATAHVTESGGDWTIDGPKYAYLQALHWDVNTDVNAVMDEFCQHSYGAAAAPMRAFWDRMEQIYERRRPTPYGTMNRRWLFYQWVGWATSSYLQPNDELREYTREDVQFFDEQMAEALRLAAGDSEAVRFRTQRMHEAWRMVRTSLVSYTQFYNLDLITRVESQGQFDDALALASEIAESRAHRKRALGAMRLYPHINPRVADVAYWSWHAGLTIFSHEQTVLDERCFAMTRYLQSSQSEDAATAFWQQFDPSDALYEAAQTQLYVLKTSNPQQMLSNGGFEAGDLAGWESSGATVSVVQTGARSGRHAARIEGSQAASLWQQLPVKPNERYRLTAWIKHLQQPPATTVPPEAEVEFYAGEQRIWAVEPTRNTLRTARPEAGWLALHSTVTVPPSATHAMVRFRSKFSEPLLLDDVEFERIKDGVDITAGALVDRFEGLHLDRNLWHPSTSTGGLRLPELREGWIVYDDRHAYPLTSLITFNHVLQHKGDACYRLHFRVARTGDPSEAAQFTWALQGSTGSIRTGVSGMYWSHAFASASQPEARLNAYASQGEQRTYNTMQSLAQLSRADDVWYILEFDPDHVSIYVSDTGYIAEDATRVLRYAHGIGDISAGGDVYLKLAGSACRIKEIAIASSAPTPTGEPGKSIRPAADPRDLIMPGVTDH